jgi:hypothetical protein
MEFPHSAGAYRNNQCFHRIPQNRIFPRGMRGSINDNITYQKKKKKYTAVEIVFGFTENPFCP